MSAALQSGHRILLVEDNADTSEALTMLLTAHGHSVATAFDGRNGLVMAHSSRYDVLICDIGLPGLNGCDLIRELRASIGANIPFAIAISGLEGDAVLERAIGAGFGHFLLKPVNTDKLLALIGSPTVRHLVSRT
jgi:CheY-like chemotaxis protein